VDDEWLSRFIDQDTDRFQTAAVLDRLVQDRAWRDRWSRYHLIRDALRGELVVVPPAALAMRIAARLAVAPTAPPTVPAPRPSRWLLAGTALAATLAAVAILPALFTASAPKNVETRSIARLAGAGRVTCDTRGLHHMAWAGSTSATPFARECTALMRKLNLLIVEHRESAASTALTGFVPYVTLIADDAAR